MKILITYYSKTGTTKEICTYIKNKALERVLVSSTIEVDVMPFNEVYDLQPYEVVIIGAPINGMRWVVDAKVFTDSHLTELKGKKVALFYVSYLLDNGWGIWQRSIHKSLDVYKSVLNPIAVGEFYGRVEKPFTGFVRMLFGSKAEAPLDRSDWKRVDKFLDEIGKAL